MSETKKRSVYWQIIRGICILSVIMIHCPSGLDYSENSFYCWVILRQIINFPVALFVFMSGYFTYTERVRRTPADYVLNRMKRLLIPFLIWSSLYTVFHILESLRRGLTINWFRLIYQFAIGKAAAPFYYIVVMLQLTLLTPWLVKLLEKEKNRWLLYLLTPAYLVIIYSYNLLAGHMPPLYETLFPAWLLFYILGLDCKKGRWNQIIQKSNVGWILLLLCVSVMEAYILLQEGCSVGFASSQIKFSSFGYTIALIFWLQKKYKTDDEIHSEGWMFWKIAGDYSYGIFYIHIFILWMAEKIMKIFCLDSIWILFFLGTFLLSTTGSLLIAACIRTVLLSVRQKKLLRLLGFQ